MGIDMENLSWLSYFTWLLVLSFTATHVLLALLKPAAKTPNLPPGPAGWPVLGNLLQLGRHPPRTLVELASTYGPIMSLRLGSVTTIVLSSASVTKELLQSHDPALRDREVYEAITAQSHNEFSPIWLAGGPKWRSLRKISNSHMFCKKSLESSRILRENNVKDIISYVKVCCNDVVPIDIGLMAFNAGLNLMSNTIFSLDLADPDSDTGREFKNLFGRMSAETGTPNVSDHFPVLKALDLQGIKRRMSNYLGKMLDLLDGLIDQRLNNLNGDRHFDDILEILLKISREPNSSIDRSDIVHLIMDLFFAGTETTGNTIEWAMAELLRNPEKMHKAREELHGLVGKGNTVSENDIFSLPYLQAVVKETLRLHPAIPLISRKNTDSNIGFFGFTIPKNSRVWINLWGIGRDPKVWTNAQSFEPERFLESEIDIRGRDFEFIPFGSGRRICMGMSLALRMVPLMVGSLINLFAWKLENGVAVESMDMEEKFGLTLQKSVPLCVIPISL